VPARRRLNDPIGRNLLPLFSAGGAAVNLGKSPARRQSLEVLSLAVIIDKAMAQTAPKNNLRQRGSISGKSLTLTPSPLVT